MDINNAKIITSGTHVYDVWTSNLANTDHIQIQLETKNSKDSDLANPNHSLFSKLKISNGLDDLLFLNLSSNIMQCRYFDLNYKIKLTTSRNRDISILHTNI